MCKQVYDTAQIIAGFWLPHLKTQVGNPRHWAALTILVSLVQLMLEHADMTHADV